MHLALRPNLNKEAALQTRALTSDSETLLATEPFTELRTGEKARLVGVELASQDRDNLTALGLTPSCRFRVARAGDPWIVQVRTTRIGLSNAVARGLRVIRETS